MLRNCACLGALLWCLTATAATSVKGVICISGLCEDVPIAVVDGVELSINIAFPGEKSEEARPLVMLVHGGGFVSGDKTSKNPQIQTLSRLGYVAASVMYRLTPEVLYPVPLQDIKLAIRYMKTHASDYHINPHRIIVSGFSAGGYLAVMAGVTGNSDTFDDYGLFDDVDSSVRAVTAQSGPIADFTDPLYSDSLTVQRLISASARKSEKTLGRLSPKTFLDPEDPPFFLTHGDADPVVPVGMSRDFVAALKRMRHPFEYIEIEGGTHSFSQSAPEEGKRSFRRYLEFLRRWSQ